MNTLSKRELLAGMAMQGLLSMSEEMISETCKGIATWSVEYADALVAELERTKPAEDSSQVPDAAKMVDPATCEWREDEDGVWDTGCGRSYEFHDGGCVENGVNFCCYCGGKLEAVRFVAPDADGWIPHTPGDPMPCDGGMKVSVKFLDGVILDTATAGNWRDDSCNDENPHGNWGKCPADPNAEIVAWRPAN